MFLNYYMMIKHIVLNLSIFKYLCPLYHIQEMENNLPVYDKFLFRVLTINFLLKLSPTFVNHLKLLYAEMLFPHYYIN